MRIVIVGGGAAGIKCAEEIINYQRNEESIKAKIIILHSENDYPYYRPFLSKSAGKNSKIEHFYLKKPKWYEDNKIDLHLSKTVTKIDFKSQIIYVGEEKFIYNRLILTPGCKSFKLPFIDYSLPGVFSLINYSDVKQISSYLNKNECKKALVVGGGILGCESAFTLNEFGEGIKVDIVEILPHIMSLLLTKEASVWLQNIIEETGVNVMVNSKLTKIIKNNNNKLVATINGKEIEYDIVVINVGLCANLDFLNHNDIIINHGIICNEYLETSVKNVYCAGDAAEIKPYMTIMLWEHALDQAKVVVNNIFYPKEKKVYNLSQIYPVSYNSFGISLKCFGNVKQVPNDAELLVINNKQGDSNNDVEKYKKAITFINYDNKTKKIYFIASFNSPKTSMLISDLKSSDNLLNLQSFKDIKE